MPFKTGEHSAADSPYVVWYIRLLLAVCGLTSAYFMLRYISLPMMEMHHWRQSQTALEIRYLIIRGLSLDYWTPAYGAGWSVPFEFPIYQSIVALATEASGLPMEAVGRLVNWLFCMGCTIPLNTGLKKAGFRPEARYTALACFMTAPVYLFWGPTVLIEGTALFFTLCFLSSAIDVVRGRATDAGLAIMALWLCLALLQKVTTVLPPVAVVLVFYAAVMVRARRLHPLPYLVRSALAFGLPLLVGYLWVAHTDHMKSLNPLGIFLTSQGLVGWNYGVEAQRFSPELWVNVVITRMFVNNGGGFVGMVGLALGLWKAPPEARRILLGLIALAALPLLIFSNLHIVHEYYQCANEVFLIAAIALGTMIAADPLRTRLPLLYCAVSTVLVALNLQAFAERGVYFKEDVRLSAINQDIITLTDYVRDNTSSAQYVVWYGVGFSTDFTYYSQRRSVTASDDLGLADDVLAHPARYLPAPPSAVVFCGPAQDANISPLQQITRQHFTVRAVKKTATCTVMLVEGWH